MGVFQNPLPILHSTGEGIDDGGKDYNYKVVEVPPDYDLHTLSWGMAEYYGSYPTPVPAIRVPHSASPNDIYSAWIGWGANMTRVASGNYKIETYFDMTGRDVSNVVISFQFQLEGYLNGIYLNGINLNVSTIDNNVTTWNPVNILTGFFPGINTLQFSWYNDPAFPINRSAIRIRVISFIY